jgi:biotin synthase
LASRPSGSPKSFAPSKQETPLAITLSLGERLPDELRLWREAGADRYLLRFETSDPALYAAIHPQRGAAISDRVALLRELRAKSAMRSAAA